MQRQVGALHAGEFDLDLFLGGVDHDRRPLAEDQFLDLDEAEHRAMAHLAGIDLEDLALVVENDLENVTGGHEAGTPCVLGSPHITRVADQRQPLPACRRDRLQTSGSQRQQHHGHQTSRHQRPLSRTRREPLARVRRERRHRRTCAGQRLGPARPAARGFRPSFRSAVPQRQVLADRHQHQRRLRQRRGRSRLGHGPRRAAAMATGCASATTTSSSASTIASISCRRRAKNNPPRNTSTRTSATASTSTTCSRRARPARAARSRSATRSACA